MPQQKRGTMKHSNEKTQKHSSATKRLVIILGIVLVLTLAVFAAFWFLVVGNIAQLVTVEAGTTTVHADSFLVRDLDIPVSIETELTTVDLQTPGDYPVQIRYMNRIYHSVLRVCDTIGPEVDVRNLSTLSNSIPDPAEFIMQIRDVTDVTVRYETEPDMSIEGEQTVTLLVTDEGGNTTQWQTTLTVVFDTQAPVIEGVQTMSIYRGQTPDYLSGVTIADDLDEEPVLTVDDSRVDLTQGGEYEVIYTGTDASGNESQQIAVLTVIVDETPPSILGVQPISLYMGSTVSYRSGILVSDDIDGNPTLSIDSSGVDLSTAGTYQVVYTAKDAAGNETTMTAEVTVKEKKGTYVEEEVIYAAVDELLATIITEGMTDTEKAEAIFNYIARHYSYYGASDKTDWMQAAYTIMRTHMGDCFNFYAISKLMLDRVGIPNITVIRADNPYRSTSHYWSLVSVDGGETYYHFDTTPHSANGYRFFMVTDEYLDYFDTYVFRGYYARDKSLYPATPTEEFE